MKYLLETTTCSRLMVDDPKAEARLTSTQVNQVLLILQKRIVRAFEGFRLCLLYLIL